MMSHDMHLHSWAAITVASIVSLAALTSSFDDNADWTKQQKWTVSVTSISFALAFFGFLFRLMKTEAFTGTHWEHGTVLVVLIFWCAGLPTLLTPEHNLAVAANGMIKDGNLFFSSWFAFMVVMMMFADIFPTKIMGDRVSKYASHWIFFGTASFIAMANAVKFWQDFCDSADEKVCARTFFAFVIGAISGLFSILFMVFQHELFEQVMSILFLAAWCFGVAYLTFNEGPASYVGIYFFSVWASFLFALCMATTSFTSLYGRMMGGDDANTSTAEAVGDQPAADGEEGKGPEETAKHDEEDPEKEETTN